MKSSPYKESLASAFERELLLTLYIILAKDPISTVAAYMSPYSGYRAPSMTGLGKECLDQVDNFVL